MELLVRPAAVARLSLVAAAVLAVAAAAVAWPGEPAAADDPHGPYTLTTDTCALCHRGHTGANPNVLPPAGTGPGQAGLCFTCHNGTGASTDVAAEYSDPLVPANNASTSSYYSHAVSPGAHLSAKDPAEFAGILNRHSDCSDCHNSHLASAAPAVAGALGWTRSGALHGATGVAVSLSGSTVNRTWKDPIALEAELCLKCHSTFTQLPAGAKETYKKTDKASEILLPAPLHTNASYHPILGAGTNSTAEMAASLAGGSLWQFSVGSTIRCTNCHGDYRTVEASTGPNMPAASARLAPHTSQYRGILVANYRDRTLKSQGTAYSAADFALCFLCHSAEPFADASGDGRADTRFENHGLHTAGIGSEGSPALGTDINAAGAGQGNALCSECHFELHSTRFAYTPGNRTYQRLVNFAPNVLGVGVQPPSWVKAGDDPGSGSCLLTCHGYEHNATPYGGAAVGPASKPGPGPLGNTGEPEPAPDDDAEPVEPGPEPEGPIDHPLGLEECTFVDCGPSPYRVICGPNGWFLDVGWDYPNRRGWPEFRTSWAWEVVMGCRGLTGGGAGGEGPPATNFHYDDAGVAVRPS